MSIYEQTADTSHDESETEAAKSAFVRPEKGRSKNSSAVVLSSDGSSTSSLPQDTIEEIIYADVEVLPDEDDAGASSSPQGAASLQSRPHSKKRRVMTLCLIAALLIILVGSMPFAISALAPTATITLAPVQKDIEGTQHIVAVTGTPHGTEIQAISMSATETSNTLTVDATGSQSIPAVAARGMITLSNNAPYPQTIVPGPGTIMTGADGIQVQLDSAVTIPKGTPPNSNGVIRVPAHAVQAGVSGNIATGDINAPCCASNVVALNEGAFTGGKDAQPYRVVAQSDIDGAVSTLKGPLTQRVQASMTAKLHSDEQLGIVTTCSQQPHSQPAVGDQASNVLVSLTMSCTGIAYSQSTVSKQATSLALSESARQFPSYVLLQHSLHISIEPAVAVAGHSNAISLLVHTQGTWVYRLDIRSIQKAVTGKHVQDARALLSREPGVQRFRLSINVLLHAPWWSDMVLPVDPSRIQVLVQSNQ